jgi:predicted lipoprotein
MRFRVLRPILAALALCACLAQTAHARDNRDTLLKAARTFIVPRYETLAKAMGAQEVAWSAFCSTPASGAVDQLKASYQTAADAWSGIEFVLYGPVSTDFRFERMAHWPERKNAIGRAMSTLLARTGAEDLTPERFSQVSAAAQGLSALERLIYDEKTAQLLKDETPAGRRACGVGQAMARGLSRTSGTVLAEWTQPGGTLAILENGDAALVESAVTRLMTDYVTLFEIIDDQKIGAVMGKNADEARPTLAEGWRSNRSMRAIAVNLESAESLARMLVDPGQDENASMFYAFESTRGLVQTLPASIGDMAADPRQRRNLVLLHDSVHSLRDLVGSTLPAALGVSVGFNSRDGD